MYPFLQHTGTPPQIQSFGFVELAALVRSLWPKDNTKTELARTLEKLRTDSKQRECAKYNLIEILTCKTKVADNTAAALEEMFNAFSGFAGGISSIIKGEAPREVPINTIIAMGCRCTVPGA